MILDSVIVEALRAPVWLLPDDRAELRAGERTVFVPPFTLPYVLLPLWWTPEGYDLDRSLRGR